MNWQNAVKGCFGEVDRILAGHPLDEQRTKEMIASAKKSGASREDAEKEVVWDCYTNGAGRDHMDQQVKKLRSMW